MLRYPALCCSGVQNKRLGVSDFSATCAEAGRANSREHNASVTLEISMMGTARRAKDPSIAPRMDGLTRLRAPNCLLDEPLLRDDRPYKRRYRQIGVRLDFKQKSDRAQDQAVHN